MAENPFTKDHIPPHVSRDDTLGLEPGTCVEIAAWIASAMASGLLGNAFTQYVNELRNRLGQSDVDELKNEVFKAMKKVKRKPGVSDQDLKLRVDKIFRDAELP